MSYEMKEGQGSLFKNTKKTKDTQPSYTGSAMWKGEKIEISLWNKVDKNGKTWLSLALKEPYKKDEDKPLLDDDIAF